MDNQLLYLYRAARKHQMNTYGLSGDHVWDDKTQSYVSTNQYVGGGACYQRHAMAAYLSAKRSIHFRSSLRDAVTKYKSRSKAAKKGWNTRRSSMN